MYCAHCGVRLADSERHCPLCGTKAYHPDLPSPTGERLYPPHRDPAPPSHSLGFAIVATAVFVLALVTVLACDLRFYGSVTWSGYTAGAILLAYVVFILPTWFRAPHPSIFVPCSFGAAACYLLYIDLATHGHWFLSFAFPVVGGLGLLTTAFATLLRYLKKGKLYVFGGTVAALGAFMPLVEWLQHLTFAGSVAMGWSFYPLTALLLGGGALLFLAICRPAREYMARKFFI